MAEAIVIDTVQMTAVFEMHWGKRIDDILALKATINERCQFEDTDLISTSTAHPVHTRLTISGRNTFRDFLGGLQETAKVKTTFLARHNVTEVEWCNASPDTRFREDPTDLRWFHSIRRRKIYSWQYEGQAGYGIVDTTDREINDVIAGLAVYDLAVCVRNINIG